MRRGLPIMLASLPVAVAACGLLVDTSGLTNPSTPPTAGPELDASSSDVGDVGEGDVPALGFCAALSPKPYFCADFDDGALTRGWQQTVVEPPSSSVELDPVASSPPNSALARIEADAAGCGYAVLHRSFAEIPATKFRLTFAVRIGEPDGGAAPGAQYMLVVFSRGDDDYCSLIFQESMGRSALAEQHQFPDGTRIDREHLMLVRPTPERFTRVDLEVDLSKSPPRVDVTLDGERAFAEPVALDARCGGASVPVLRAGIHCNGTQPVPTLVRLDDIALWHE